jgi:hypothetical protein
MTVTQMMWKGRGEKLNSVLRGWNTNRASMTASETAVSTASAEGASSNAASTSSVPVVVSDEVHLWLGWSALSWGADLDISAGLALLEENVHEGLLLVLFGQDDLSLLAGGGGRRLHKDQVHVLVLATRDTDDAGLAILWLIGGRVNIHVAIDLSTTTSAPTEA